MRIKYFQFNLDQSIVVHEKVTVEELQRIDKKTLIPKLEKIPIKVEQVLFDF